jgi:YHS domain-containing protein
VKRILIPALAMVAGLAIVAARTASTKDAKMNAEVKAPMAFDKAPEVGVKATCPVSRQEFTITEKTVMSEHAGKHYAFCCPSCKPKFDKDPEKYLKPDHAGGH